MFRSMKPSLILKRFIQTEKRPNISLRQLENLLKTQGENIELFKSNKKYRYTVPLLLLGGLASYGVFDMLTWMMPLSVELLQKDLEEENMTTRDKAIAVLKRIGPPAIMTSLYFTIAVTSFSIVPRVVKKIRYDPLTQMSELQTFLGKAKPVSPFTSFKMGKYTKAYTGEGKYGASSRGIFFFLWPQGSRIPYIIDRSSEFHPSALAFDYFLNKEFVAKDIREAEMKHAGTTFQDSSKRAVLESLSNKKK